MCDNPISKTKRILNFKLKWDKWRGLLEELVDTPHGRLVCPTSGELIIQDQNNSVQIHMPYAICMHGVPMKPSSGKSSQLAVFIDGNYELEAINQDNELRRIKSSIAFYRMSGLRKKVLELLDAFHFDFWESMPFEHSPHPVFHVQRSFRQVDSERRFRESLSRTPALMKYTFSERDVSGLFKFGRFRIPTPQMDILNLGAVVAADLLVEYDNDSRWGNFLKLLNEIHGNDGNANHVCVPDRHEAGIYSLPRKKVADWYVSRCVSPNLA